MAKEPVSDGTKWTTIIVEFGLLDPDQRLGLSRVTHELGGAAVVGSGKDDIGAPHVRWRAATRGDRLEPTAICRRDVDDSSCFHSETLGGFVRLGNRLEEAGPNLID